MNFKFAVFFITQCEPLLAVLLVGLLAWIAVKALLQFRDCGFRRYTRHQTMWSNWS